MGAGEAVRLALRCAVFCLALGGSFASDQTLAKEFPVKLAISKLEPEAGKSKIQVKIQNVSKGELPVDLKLIGKVQITLGVEEPAGDGKGGKKVTFSFSKVDRNPWEFAKELKEKSEGRTIVVAPGESLTFWIDVSKCLAESESKFPGLPLNLKLDFSNAFQDTDAVKAWNGRIGHRLSSNNLVFTK